MFEARTRVMRSVQQAESPVAAIAAQLTSDTDISTALATNYSKQIVGLQHARSLYSEYPGDKTSKNQSKRAILHQSLR